MNDWVKVNKQVQKFGIATCNVSNILINVDILREEGHFEAAHMLASAARDILENRKLARKRAAFHLNQKKMPLRKKKSKR